MTAAPPERPAFYRRHGKRWLDVGLTLLLLPGWGALLVLAWLLAAIDQRGAALFIQERPGLNERPFRCFKLRTMRDTLDENGQLLPDEQRLTPVGRWLRQRSWDELPQLLNVLRGEMSLVGPRPLLMDYLPHYSAGQRRRHLVRPGLTGLAQIHEEQGLSWAERLAYDSAYADQLSLRTDARILAITFGQMLGSLLRRRRRLYEPERFDQVRVKEQPPATEPV